VLAATRSAVSTARKSGHLDSAVDPAAMPLGQRSCEVAALVPALAEAAMSFGRRAG